MSRDQLTRMDVDTNWPYHHRVRALQQQEPQLWPTYWAAYLALLAEAWRAGTRRRTLVEAWCPALPCRPEAALAALVRAGVVDRHGRIPQASWAEWYGPAAERIATRSKAGLRAAHNRWHAGAFEACGPCQNGTAMPPHSAGNAPSQPSIPSKPPTPAPARAQSRTGGGLASLRDLLAPPPGYKEAKP